MIGVLAAWLAHADQTLDALTASGVQEFQGACQAWDAARFTRASQLLRQASEAPNASSTQYYWLGVSEFHRMLQCQSVLDHPSPSPEAEAAMESALAALQKAVKLDERHAECHALLGTLYGMKIEGNLVRALRFGPRVQKHRELALRHGANNPRVLYLLGACQFHTARKAAAWREALESFRAAERLFASEAQRTPAPLEPRWGRSSCLTFMGRTHEALGEAAEAAASFRRALELHPADLLARQGLARVQQTK